MTTFDERTGLEILPIEECWEHLLASTVGRLGVCVGSHPDIFPINYAVEGGRAGSALLIRTAPGTKLAAAVLGSAVAFEIDDIDAEHHQGWSVVVHGHATEVEDLEELMALEDAEDGPQPWAKGVRSRFVRLHPDEVTGRRIPGAG